MSTFHIVPVIDIMDGLAVHARRGQRDQYRPVQSVLSADAVPESLANGMVGLHRFPQIYVADLNAIMGKGGQHDVISTLTPHAEIWLDQGISTPDQAKNRNDVTFVVGSESLPDVSAWSALKALVPDTRLILSLDFDPAGNLKGPSQLWQTAELWPSRVIVMILDRVGSGGGPDLDRLMQAQSKSDAAQIYAAGGVRNMADVTTLTTHGLSGALIATALHDGTLFG